MKITGNRCPPKENDKLTATQLGFLESWIAQRAPWPSEERIAALLESDQEKWAQGIRVTTSGGLDDTWTNRGYEPENLWAYQPIAKVEPPRSGHPVDAFIDQRLEQLNLSSADLADRRTLIRRVTFGLTGLPPTPKEIENFLTDKEPTEKAFAKVVDRLLESPHYGERMAQHWLDVVRYADSSGFANDYVRGNTWRYRDYVIRAFNDDKPYDDFIREQIAGDEMDASDPEKLVAVGFLRMGPWELTGMEVAKVARQRFLDDVTDIVGQTFLAHMMQCARCHDHKFDPVPTRDYYSMQAVFSSTQLVERPAAFLECENTSGFAEEKKILDARKKAHNASIKALNSKVSLDAGRQWLVKNGHDVTTFDMAVEELGKNVTLQKVRKHLQDQKVSPNLIPPLKAGFTPADYGLERVSRKGLQRLAWEYDRYQPVAFSVHNGVTVNRVAVHAPIALPENPNKGGTKEKTSILAGGDPFSPTEDVSPGVLSAVNHLNPKLAASIPSTMSGRRSSLAHWIASPSNPLTPRVIVNRVWQWHFGQALAGNPNNFGATGKKPSHPKLLDWLANEFVQSGWSFKHLNRLIVSSDTYRRSTEHPAPDALAEKDAHGTSYAVFRPRRLSAEELRDAMLEVSGELNKTLGGIPSRPEINFEAAMQPRQVMGSFAEAWQPNPLPRDRHRRSIYALRIRGQRDPMMEVFNSPPSELSCEARESSTVTPQVFSLFNSQSTYQRALALAARVQQETNTDHAAIERAFRLVNGRPPDPEEAKACLAHWQSMTIRHGDTTIAFPSPPTSVRRDAIEENTGEKFSFTEYLPAYESFVADLQPQDVDTKTRALADVCLVLFNANEFSYVY